MKEIKKKICAALAAVLCTALLVGCSPEEVPANVYLPGELITNSSSTTSSTVKDEDQYNGFVRPPSSSSTQSSSTTSYPSYTAPEETYLTVSDSALRWKWYYFHITDKQRSIYRRLYNCVLNGGEGCDVSDLFVTDQDVYEAFWAFDYENPQFPELGDGYEITYLDRKISNKVKSIKILYNRMPSGNMHNALETRAETILTAARALGTDYERLKYIHDWLVNNTTYSDTGAEYESEADGPIVYGQALCEGYSKAFMYLAQRLGYPCICSVGVANLEDHMWNMVKIGVKWYNVDVTWDDPDNTTAPVYDPNDVSAPNNANDPDNNPTEDTDIRHDYFLICDAEIRLDHRVRRPDMLPTSPYGYFPHGYDQDANS